MIKREAYFVDTPITFALLLCLSILSTGCQSLSSSSTTARVRIVDASPDSPMLDVYQRSGALTYNLAFANITSYIDTPSGSSDLSVDISGSHKPLAALHETLDPSSKYTLLLGGTAGTLQSTLLKDQSAPAPAGQASLRFLDQINAEGAVDVYLVPSGSTLVAAEPILLNKTFTANSGYLNIPAGAYRIVLYAAGAVPSETTRPAYSGPTATYPSGAARTILLLDRRTIYQPAFQSIVIEDFEPPSPAN